MSRPIQLFVALLILSFSQHCIAAGCDQALSQLFLGKLSFLKGAVELSHTDATALSHEVETVVATHDPWFGFVHSPTPPEEPFATDIYRGTIEKRLAISTRMVEYRAAPENNKKTWIVEDTEIINKFIQHLRDQDKSLGETVGIVARTRGRIILAHAIVEGLCAPGAACLKLGPQAATAMGVATGLVGLSAHGVSSVVRRSYGAEAYRLKLFLATIGETAARTGAWAYDREDISSRQLDWEVAGTQANRTKGTHHFDVWVQTMAPAKRRLIVFYRFTPSAFPW
ncbi:MAG: hypothetical protein HY537_00625 [Deltaproteobacteria bacterium]|nr:hypothetical protein [Deltaproteobacteria bacterium]